MSAGFQEEVRDGFDAIAADPSPDRTGGQPPEITST
jgi:hypothetical protein